MIIALDRQEKGAGQLSAVQEIEQEFTIPVISLINLQMLIEYLQANNEDPTLLQSIIAYLEQYGVV